LCWTTARRSQWTTAATAASSWGRQRPGEQRLRSRAAKRPARTPTFHQHCVHAACVRTALPPRHATPACTHTHTACSCSTAAAAAWPSSAASCAAEAAETAACWCCAACGL
jgi:hypothetical protein